MRITKENLYGTFSRLIECIGGKMANKYNDEGAYRLQSFAPGHWQIHRIISPNGAVECVGQTLSTREMYEALHFSRAIIREMENIKQKEKGE